MADYQNQAQENELNGTRGIVKGNTIQEVRINEKKFFIASYIMNGNEIKYTVFNQDKKIVANYNSEESSLEMKDDATLNVEEINELTSKIQDYYENTLVDLIGLVDLSAGDRPLISLGRGPEKNTDGDMLYTKLGLDDSELRNKLPEGLSISSFISGKFTYIKKDELPKGMYVKYQDAELIPAITNRKSYIFNR